MADADPADPVAPTDAEATRLPRESEVAALCIGPYRLLRRLGEGGMGEVWLADQTQPVRRSVAVKLIKAGMDTARVIARFEAERQALALMDHPNIAKVFDGGSTREGRPYFVMEFVRGEPLTTYCDRVNMPLRDRLELFASLCEGVQHAHQKGIIHRDLKPSNVLVSLVADRPVPRIIDFGIAKATAEHLTEASFRTELGQFVGTPEYMSPEQADPSHVDVDTRTDVYSLGIILYELLTGLLPFDYDTLRVAGADQMRRTIRETDTPRPSTRVRDLGNRTATVAASRSLPPAKLVAALRGELDWITLKATDKDRARRYDSAMALANDVRRFLRDEAVEAGPPSAIYKTQKFVRRHRFGVTAAASLLLLTVGFGVTMAVQAQRIARERDRANKEGATARQVSEFLTNLFESPDPRRTRGAEVTARQLLDVGAERVRKDLQAEPEVQSSLMATMSKAYRSLGVTDAAADLAKSAYDIRRSLFGADRLETASAQHDVALTLLDLGRIPEAEDNLKEVLSVYERILTSEDPRTLNVLNSYAAVLNAQGKWAEAEQQLRRVVDKLNAVPADPKAVDVRLRTVNNLGVALHQQGKLADAEKYYRQAVDASQRARGRDDASTLIYLSNLAEVLDLSGNLSEAGSRAQEVLEARRRVLPAGHRGIAYANVTLASVLIQQQRTSEAEPHLAEALAVFDKSPAAVNEYVGVAHSLFGEVLMARNEPGAAEHHLRDGYQQLITANASLIQKKRAIQRLVRFYESLHREPEAATWRAREQETK
jgi:non-specific serine/threonine protein kinase/serine/threonine-protein kinase